MRQVDSDSLIYSIPQFRLLQTSEKLFIEELLRLTSEHNLYQISYILENHSGLFTYKHQSQDTLLPNNILAPLLLYINKIEMVVKQL